MNQRETEPTKARDTCESALRDLGIDEAFVMEKLKEKLEAKDRRWNPKKKSWEEFDDRATQLAAARELAKISGAHLSRKRDDDYETPAVIVTRIPRYERRS